MSHTIAPSLPRRPAQAGHLLERPSPARITAIAGVIALHGAALMLLMMPMAPPQALPTPDVDIPYVPVEKKETKRVDPPPEKIEKIPPRPTTTPREVAIPQPPVVDPVGTDVAPPYDPNPDTAIVIDTVPPVVGPMRAESLEYASAPPPAYPRDAMARRIEGTVILEVLVGVDGVPLDVRVATSSGNHSLDEAARKHILKKWKFKPATKDGHAVQALGLVPVKFVLR
jgi:protein TonB